MTLHYSGDINIEHGGVLYSLANAKYDYADAVRVTPVSDAGGPANQFWVETIVVNLPTDPDGIERVLGCIGLTTEEYKTLTRARRLHALVDACICYGKYDQDKSEVVQVGVKVDPFWSAEHHAGFDPVKVDVVLRGNASLKRYARSQMDD